MIQLKPFDKLIWFFYYVFLALTLDFSRQESRQGKNGTHVINNKKAISCSYKKEEMGS